MGQLHSLDFWKEILYIVSLREGAYESIQPSSNYPGLTQKTIKQVWEIQKSRKGPGVTAACGRYQIVGRTKDDGAAFKTTAERVGLNWDVDLFSPLNQDKMAVALIEGKRGVTKELIQSNPIEAALRLAKEWASLPVLAATNGQNGPVNRGDSYYKGDGLNKAGVTPEQVEAAFARFLGLQPTLSDYRGLAAANEDPALTTAGFGTGADNAPTYSASTYNPVVTQRESPLVSIDQMLDLLRPENRVQNTPATTARITQQQSQDDRYLQYRSNLYASKSYKQTVLPPRDMFWGIVTDVITIPKEELSIYGAQDLMINYATINEINTPILETVAYFYPLIDQTGNMLEYLPDNLDSNSLSIDRSLKYQALYDRLSIGNDASSTQIAKDKIIKVRMKGPNLNMLRIVGVIGSATGIFANLISGLGGSSGYFK